MTVGSQADIDGLKKIGKIVGSTILEMKSRVRAGMTTQELDEIGGTLLSKHGAVPAPQKTYKFPGNTCISINQEVAHGIPGNRVIRAGDLINIDVSAELDGYVADAGHSFQLAPYRSTITTLCQHAYDTMMKVVSSLSHGVKMNEIGKIIEREAEKGGYSIIRNLCSHGVGRSLHEYPTEILPFYSKHEKRVLKEGMVITIEPFLSTGAGHVVQQADGWTLRVPDNSYVAQHEHTIIITKKEPIIVTAV